MPSWPRAQEPYPGSFVALGQVEPCGSMESLTEGLHFKRKGHSGESFAQRPGAEICHFISGRGGLPHAPREGLWVLGPCSQLPCPRLQSQWKPGFGVSQECHLRPCPAGAYTSFSAARTNRGAPRPSSNTFPFLFHIPSIFAEWGTMDKATSRCYPELCETRGAWQEPVPELMTQTVPSMDVGRLCLFTFHTALFQPLSISGY
ncbi:hypothetical protein MC885_007952 [Smutsia gigantea]|nr:hypothetical protein MC885_007952 [Smutsia gigantea]